MYQTINFSSFMTAFKAHDRQDQFSYDAQRLLFDYLEEREDDIGKPIELDVIALCCEYEEASVAEVIASIASYDIDIPADSDEDAERLVVMEYLEAHTTVIGETCVDTILFAQF